MWVSVLVQWNGALTQGCANPGRGPAISLDCARDRLFRVGSGIQRLAMVYLYRALGPLFTSRLPPALEFVDLGLERVDPRSVPALLAEAIGEGALSDATRGADRLHVYGLLYDLRSRRRLVRALHEQPDAGCVDSTHPSAVLTLIKMCSFSSFVLTLWITKGIGASVLILQSSQLFQ